MFIIAHFHGPIEIRENVTVEVNGLVHVLPNNRVLNPGDDVSRESPEIQQACSDWWTSKRTSGFMEAREMRHVEPVEEDGHTVVVQGYGTATGGIYPRLLRDNNPEYFGVANNAD